VNDRRAEAVATLRRLGLDADDVAAGRVAVGELAPHLAGPDAEALVVALGTIAAPASATLLAALEPLAGPPALRKAVRRSLHRLRQRGVDVPTAPAPAPPRPARPADGAIEGLVSAVDGRGDRLVWLVRTAPAGDVVLLAAQLNEPGGLVDVQLAEPSRKQLRAARRQLEREAGVRLVTADWRVLDALVVEAHGRVPDAGRPRARDYLRARPRLTADPPAAPAEPVSARVAPPEGDEAAALVGTSAALLNEPELRSWWPAPDAVAPIVERIAAAQESPLVVSRAAQEERLREEIAGATRTLVPPDVFARRLAGTAYVLAETGRREPARRALAVAAVLRARPDAVATVPFAVAYVERALAGLLQRAEGARAEERREALVVTPGEYLRDRSSSRPPHTRG
jgi:hypothetical protein